MKKKKLKRKLHMANMAITRHIAANDALRAKDETRVEHMECLKENFDDMKARLFDMSTQVFMIKREKNELIVEHQKTIEKIGNALGMQAVADAMKEKL